MTIKLPVTSRHDYSITRDVTAHWIFNYQWRHVINIQLTVTSRHEYSITHDVSSWIFITYVIVIWICMLWRHGCLNIHDDLNIHDMTSFKIEYSWRDVMGNWIFNYPDVTLLTSHSDIKLPMTSRSEYSIAFDITSWIFNFKWSHEHSITHDVTHEYSINLH